MQALPTIPGLLGLHLEGPYINPSKRRVHPAGFVQVPVLTDLVDLLNWGRGVLRMLTLALEVLGPQEATFLRTAGVVPSTGDSNASYEQGMHAFAHGFAAATPLFNAMPPLTSRALGLVGAVYDDQTVRASIVADGRHCAYANVRVSHRLLGAAFSNQRRDCRHDGRPLSLLPPRLLCGRRRYASRFWANLTPSRAQLRTARRLATSGQFAHGLPLPS